METRRTIDRSERVDRPLYLAQLRDLDTWPAAVEQPTGQFVVFTALDARRSGDHQLREFARRLLVQGCVYACSWGPGAGRLENAFDHEIVTAQLAGRPYLPDDDVVMTISYVEESFDEALWFAVFNAFPTHGGDALIAICGAEWARPAESRLADCRQLSDDVLDQEDEPDV